MTSSRASRPASGGRNDRIGPAGDGVPADSHTDIAHPARVYDYWLGGKDNFAADRAAAEQVLNVMPEILDTVRGNRQFLVRAVRFVRDAGIRQFIDLGSGLPSSPNVHEVAQAGDPRQRPPLSKPRAVHFPGRPRRTKLSAIAAGMSSLAVVLSLRSAVFPRRL
jgi:hypothetical protein